MCVTEFGVLHAGIQLILTCPMRRAQSPFLPVPRQEVKVLPGSGPTEPCTHKHTQRHDGHRRQAQVASLLLNSRTPIIKCPSSPIKTNSLDCAPLLSIGLTDTNDCVIHPPQPHPLLTAPVSHTALAQSGEIVSCLFLNTHLYLTAYWVSISPNVHYVWMCSWACVRVCVCVSVIPVGLRLQCDMPVMFASLPHLEGVLVHQAAGVMERGGCLAEGGLVVGGLKTHTHPIPSAGERYQEWDDCGCGSRGKQGREWGGGGGEVLEWKNTISQALLQCLSSQLVTLKHQSWVIISNCWRKRTQWFGPLSRFSSALMGESGMGRTKAAGESKGRDGLQKWLWALIMAWCACVCG